MSNEQLKSCLSSAGISKEMLSQGSQETLTKLVQALSFLKMHTSLLSPESAVLELLNIHTSQTSVINSEIELLSTIQEPLRQSYKLLGEVRSYKNSIKDRQKDRISENITYNLIPKREKLTKTMPKKFNLAPGLKHENLISRSEECQAVMNEVSTLEKKAEVFSGLPKNVEQAQRKVHEAQQELENLQNQWIQRVNEMYEP